MVFARVHACIHTRIPTYIHNISVHIYIYNIICIYAFKYVFLYVGYMYEALRSRLQSLDLSLATWAGASSAAFGRFAAGREAAGRHAAAGKHLIGGKP